jgi:hypothetical protein
LVSTEGLSPSEPSRGCETSNRRRAAYLSAALRREIEHVTGAAEGGRNAALYTAAVALGQLVAGGALTTTQVESLLEQAAAGHIAARAPTR